MSSVPAAPMAAAALDSRAALALVHPARASSRRHCSANASWSHPRGWPSQGGRAGPAFSFACSSLSSHSSPHIACTIQPIRSHRPSVAAGPWDPIWRSIDVIQAPRAPGNQPAVEQRGMAGLGRRQTVRYGVQYVVCIQ